MKCCLCNLNEANQTGAHIFPAWMISSAFDKNARNRGYEIIHTMTTLDSDLPFFGNSILPENEIQSQIGRDLTDKEISSQYNMLVVDNLWCRDCENKFKVTEDYFLENTDRKSNSFTANNQITMQEFENSDKYIIRLFIYTLIFRAHLGNLFGFSLNKRALKNIKKYLNFYLKDTLKETLSTISKSENKEQLLKYPIRCIKTEQKDNEAANFVYLDKRYRKPSCFIINRYIIQFYGCGNHSRFSDKSFFGLCSLIGNSTDIRNYKETRFKLGLLNINAWEQIKKNFVNKHGDIRMNNFIDMYKRMFKSKLHFEPNREQVSIFLKELVDNDVELGIKYTKEKIIKAANRSMMPLISTYRQQ